MTACRRALPLLETFVDGELPAAKVIELEQHLAECELCAARVQLSSAVRVSTRKVVSEGARPSPSLELRIKNALAAERDREALIDSEFDEHNRLLPWRFIMPVAAAAAFILVWAASVTGPPVPQATPHKSQADMASSTTASVEQLIDEFVRYHVDDPAPQVTSPALVQRFAPAVGVPVRLPSLQQYGARWEGGSLLPVRNRRAASLRYEIDGHRVSVYIYDSSRFPLRVTLEPRVVRNIPVYVGTRHGYSIAAVEQRGVGYAVASDLTNSESAELVASIR
jgi:anti-sigma factor RsiW